MEDIFSAGELVNDLGREKGVLPGDPREDHAHAAGHAPAAVAGQAPSQDVLGGREHPEGVEPALGMLRQHHLKHLRGVQADRQCASGQGAAAGAAEDQVSGESLGVGLLRGQVLRQQVLPQPVRHAKMVAVQPAAGVKSKAHLPSAGLRGRLRLPLLLDVEVGVEDEPIKHDDDIEHQHRLREVHAPEGIQAIDGVHEAQHQLQHLDAGDARLTEERHATLREQRQTVECIDHNAGAGVDSRWEVSVAAASVAAHKEPAPHVQHPEVDVQERDLPELLPDHHEERVQELQLAAVVVEPDVVAQAMALLGVAEQIPPRVAEAQRPCLCYQMDEDVQVQQHLRHVVDHKRLEDDPTNRQPRLHQAPGAMQHR
mmetsp:Transcript_12746/g.36150  ORF Transcript_12746/g.36150 Transcript_12746/m.36150 type:complete len:370 (-) Transcript_12746:607-1716(-)